MNMQAIEMALPHVPDPNTALDTATTKSVSNSIEPQAPVEPAGSYTVADAFETVSFVQFILLATWLTWSIVVSADDRMQTAGRTYYQGHANARRECRTSPTCFWPGQKATYIIRKYNGLTDNPPQSNDMRNRMARSFVPHPYNSLKH
jgi:hypothetical protein